MEKFVFIWAFLFCTSLNSIAQSETLNIKVDSLRYLTKEPFSCNSIYWKVISEGKQMIPILIDKMDDTTKINASLTCKTTNVKLGDVCFQILTEIFNIPLFYVTNVQFDFIDQYGCRQGVFNYLHGNRAKFKQQVFDYYTKYKSHLKFVKYDKSYQNECKIKNHIFGYYNIDTKFLK